MDGDRLESKDGFVLAMHRTGARRTITMDTNERKEQMTTNDETEQYLPPSVEEVSAADSVKYIAQNQLVSTAFRDCQRIVARHNGFVTGFIAGYNRAINDLKETIRK